MPTSHGRAIAAVVFVFVLTFSPYAHADTSVVPIGDPYTDTLQLWTNIISAVEALAHDLATSLIAIQSHAANSNDQNPQRQLPSAGAQSAAAALATQSGSNTATSSTNQNPFATSGELAPNATSDQTTNSSNVKSAASLPTYNSAISNPTNQTPVSNFVTQDELNAQLLLLSNVLTAKFSAPATSPVPQYIAAGGNNENPFAAANAIDNLNNVTITNANLTASEIPTNIVAANYLPLSGGTLSGDLSVSGTLTAGTLSVAGISSSGALLGPYFSATSTTATSTFAGGFSVGANQFVVQQGSGNIGIGTTTPGSIFSINNILNLTSATSSLYGTGGIDLAGGCFAIGANCLALSNISAIVVDVQQYVTGGTGTITNPYTGWSSSITWTAGTTYQFAPGFYQFSTLPIDVPVTLAGSGWSSLSGGTFGGAGWLDAGTNSGTVLLSTATSGNALTFNSASNSYPYNVRGLLILGPGTGTSTGVSMGSNSVASVQSNWSNVEIANFSVGATFTNVEDSTFTSLRFDGDTTGLELGLNTNQNVFTNLELQHGTTGFTDSGDAKNTVDGGIAQAETTGFSISGDSLTLRDIWGEENTTLFAVNSTSAGVKDLTISNARASSTNFITFTGGDTVNYLLLQENEWGNGNVTIPSNVENAVLINNEFSSLTDNGVGTSIIDNGLGSKLSSLTLGQALSVSSGGTGAQTLAGLLQGNGTSSITTVSGTAGQFLYFNGTNTVLATSTLFLSSTGNIGIGTVSPNKLLTVNAGSGGTAASITGQVDISTNRGSLAPLELLDSGASGHNWTIGPDNAGDISFRDLTASGAPVRMTITGSGNVGIGTTLPLTALSVQGTAGANDILNIASSTGASLLYVNAAGNVGIGTSSPYSRLTVWGPDTASTSAFSVVNSASTTVFSVFDSGNATYSGSIFQSSDQRLKTDITSLDASSSLSAIEQLNPVSYFRLDQPGMGENLGFIAQQVQQIFPQLVSTTSATALTPGGTLTLNYEGLIAPVISAIQALYADIASVQNIIAGFANSFTTNQLTFNRATGDEVDTQTLCLTSGPNDTAPVCVTKAQLAAVLAAANASQSPGQGSGSGSDTQASTTPDTPPVIQINGDNPAIVQIGDTYNDLGATITSPQADLNLGIETYVNGTQISPVQIDTTAAATDTIDYVATDQNGLTATSTRTVLIEEAIAATSTAQ